MAAPMTEGKTVSRMSPVFEELDPPAEAPELCCCASMLVTDDDVEVIGFGVWVEPA